jgi:hypothetical protein
MKISDILLEDAKRGYPVEFNFKNIIGQPNVPYATAVDEEKNRIQVIFRWALDVVSLPDDEQGHEQFINATSVSVAVNRNSKFDFLKNSPKILETAVDATEYYLKSLTRENRPDYLLFKLDSSKLLEIYETMIFRRIGSEYELIGQPSDPEQTRKSLVDEVIKAYPGVSPHDISGAFNALRSNSKIILFGKRTRSQKSPEMVTESAATELAKKLPSLEKHDYDTIDQLMRKIAKKHRITADKLHKLFVKKYHKIPDNWIKDILKKSKKKKLHEDTEPDLNNDPVVKKFKDWCCELLKINNDIDIEFSYDTDQAQSGHHTGRHTPGDGKIWVYAANRNLVDILRTLAHELRHVQQGEQGKIRQGDSYPGSPIEQDADAWAGMIIKIFGKKHPQIFQ